MIGQQDTWAEIISSVTTIYPPARPRKVRWPTYVIVVLMLCLGLAITVGAITLTGAEPLGMTTDPILLG